jgi:TatD DNase family protein
VLTDTHVHLHRHEFASDLPATLQRAAAAGVTRFLNVGYDYESSLQAVEMARNDERFLASVGVHPHDAAQIADDAGRVTPQGRRLLQRLEELARRLRVVAFGEIGLDFYRDLSPRPAQRTALAAQLELADRLQLPVIFHIRDAYDETVALIESVGLPRRRGVLHAFAGAEKTARWACEHGLRLGIGGPVTYKNSHLPRVLAACSPDDLLLETDAPWLPPVPYRGRRNEPAYVRLVAEKVAGLMNLPTAELARRTNAGCRELFGDYGFGADS